MTPTIRLTVRSAFIAEQQKQAHVTEYTIGSSEDFNAKTWRLSVLENYISLKVQKSVYLVYRLSIVSFRVGNLSPTMMKRQWSMLTWRLPDKDGTYQ